MIQFIVFSRARPLQLAGYLTSLYKHCSGDFRVSVLAKVDVEFEEAYTDLVREFGSTRFVTEYDFARQLLSLIGDAEFTCFGCDDAVFVEPFSGKDISGWFIGAAMDVLGLSLRLGHNITRDMFGGSLPQPEFSFGAPYWDFTAPGSVGDWAYPWEVLGTVYRTEFVKEMVAAINPGSPSQLEERGSRIWAQHTDLCHMAAYPTSRLVVPTVNLVQNEFPNGIKGTKPLSPEFLLECWNNGLRLDADRYQGMAPESWRVGEFYLKRCQ